MSEPTVSAKNMLAKRLSRGFTLIELLVVIAIIALLASIVLISLSNVQTKARDSKRENDMAQVLRAIEIYRSENDTYPPHGGTQFGGCTSANCLSVLTDDLVPNYLPSIPSDPKAGNTPSGYRYCRADPPRDGYQIIVRLEQNSSYCTVRVPTPITGSGTSCWTVNGVPDFPYCD